VVGCSDNTFEAFETPTPVSVVPTGIADENSFTIGRIPAAVEGLGFNDVESEVVVHVADRHNHPVPDDTVIRFLTNGGSIQPSCTTVDGTCTVIWKSQNPRPGGLNPGVPGRAVILAYTEGEESFLDMNDNDAHDAGEIIRDITEPFIDHNLSGGHDADEEFVDYDGDLTFDPADGVYTGESCIGDNTVCRHSRLFVWGSTIITMSGSAFNFAYNPAAPSPNTDDIVPISVTITDINGNEMPADTKVDFSAADGQVAPSSITVPASGQRIFTINYTAPTAAGNDSLTVKVTGPVSATEINNTLTFTVN